MLSLYWIPAREWKRLQFGTGLKHILITAAWFYPVLSCFVYIWNTILLYWTVTFLHIHVTPTLSINDSYSCYESVETQYRWFRWLLGQSGGGHPIVCVSTRLRTHVRKAGLQSLWAQCHGSTSLPWRGARTYTCMHTCTQAHTHTHNLAFDCITTSVTTAEMLKNTWNAFFLGSARTQTHFPS